MESTNRTAALFVACFALATASACSANVSEPDHENVGASRGKIIACPGSGYRIWSLNSGLCVAPTSNSIQSPSWLGQYQCDCNEEVKQSWVYVEPYSPSVIISYCTNANGQTMCFDRPWGSTDTYTQIQEYPCHYGASQRWYVRTFNYHGTDYAQFEAATTDTSGNYVHTHQCIDVPGFSTDVGTILQLYPCKSPSDPSPENQLFGLRP